MTKYNSPCSSKAYDSEIFAFPFLKDFTSELLRTIPASKNSLKKYLNKKIKCFLDGLTEDGLFFSARPTLWAPEIDGDILINESEIENLEIGKLYNVQIENLAGDQLIGKIVL